MTRRGAAEAGRTARARTVNMGRMGWAGRGAGERGGGPRPFFYMRFMNIRGAPWLLPRRAGWRRLWRRRRGGDAGECEVRPS
jgi:hypothetical protein